MRRALTIAATVGVILAFAAPAAAQSSVGSGQTDSLLIILGAAGAGVALFLLIWILFGPNSSVERDLRGRLGSYFEDGSQDQGLMGRIPLLRRFVRRAESVAERRGLLGNIETALEQANMPVRPGEAIAGAIGIAAVIGLVAGLLGRNVLWAIVGAGLTLFIAAASVQSIAARERKRFEDQLPDTLNLISTSLRAGYSLLQAVEAVAAEAHDPTAREFGRAISETRLGRSPVDALKDTADRMESVDFDWAVLAIGIQREVGGNLAEVLQTASETMMARNRLRREMRALTAEGRISAIVLGGLPFFLFGFLFLTNRDYLDPLFSRTGGIIALLLSVLVLIAGIFWLTRIVKVEI